eukprot:TRINITY_DN30753_c0_g2_i2.p1 TRINITY_DN30753_c0_g2~~TRINITY_DN30753_c0_g2_i2.p1  ORF type:complete len:308 (-),score=47.32 TRINITY_DN30753_c0_g2_i2:23-946(-)
MCIRDRVRMAPAGSVGLDPAAAAEQRGGGALMEQFRYHRKRRGPDPEHRPSKRAAAPKVTLRPFISPETRWRERYSSVTLEEFQARAVATVHAEVPLRALLIGHNPSEHSWQSGTGYSNPSNRFWPTLRLSGMLPGWWRSGQSSEVLCNCMGSELGIGITDVICSPGSDASEFSHPQMLRARDDLYARLRGHVQRAGAPPRVIVFIGKRQFGQLFHRARSSVTAGAQSVLPPFWPLPLSTDVHVVSSPSGRAALSVSQRVAEYAAVVGLLDRLCPICLLYTSDAADEEDSVDLGGWRIIKKKKGGDA